MAFDLSKLFPEDNEKHFPGSMGERIKKLRELRGLTQKQLGMQCGFKESTADVRISQYEKNKKIPNPETLAALATALDVDELFFHDFSMIPWERVFYLLFDMEEFFTIHPIKGDSGKYYLEFGGSDRFGRVSDGREYDAFLKDWYEKREELGINSYGYADDKIREKAENDYYIWKSSYFKKKQDQETERRHNERKLKQLQSEMDKVYAQMVSDETLSRIDKALEAEARSPKPPYGLRQKESELISFVEKMYLDYVPIIDSLPEAWYDADREHRQLLSFEVEETLNDKKNLSYLAEWVNLVKTLQFYGIRITRSISSKEKKLYLTYKYPSKQFEYFLTYHACWRNIEMIREIKEKGTMAELKRSQEELSEKALRNDINYATSLSKG